MDEETAEILNEPLTWMSSDERIVLACRGVAPWALVGAEFAAWLLSPNEGSGRSLFPRSQWPSSLSKDDRRESL
jgi:hypothetical protein